VSTITAEAEGITRTVNVQSPSGDLARTAELPAAIFDVQVNVPLIHQVVVAQLAAARQGTADTKTRGEVSGGGKKPYRQKGTGRARQGSIRSPQFAGGGVAHGPTPRNYEQRTPKKMKAAALRGALSDRARHGRVHVVSGVVDTALTVPSTKAAAAHLRSLVGSRHVLVVVERRDELTWKSLRNVQEVHLIAPGQLNTYDVLVSDDVVFTEGALAEFLAGPPKGKGASAEARESELGDLADAVTVLAEEPQAPEKVSTSKASTEKASTEKAAPKKTSKAAKKPAAAATSEGTTEPAGEDVSDAEMVSEVKAATSSDLEAEPAFEAEAKGAASDTEAAKDPDGVGK
jgi:large subunit ribosomal protein L4